MPENPKLPSESVVPPATSPRPPVTDTSSWTPATGRPARRQLGRSDGGSPPGEQKEEPAKVAARKMFGRSVMVCQIRQSFAGGGGHLGERVLVKAPR